MPKPLPKPAAGLSVPEQADLVKTAAGELERLILDLSSEARDRIGTHFLGAALKGCRAASLGCDQLLAAFKS